MISLVFLFRLQVHGVSLVTMDDSQVAAFQDGAQVLGFDAISPYGGGGSSGNTGVPIQPESQLTDQLGNLGVLFSSTAGPAGVVSVQGLGNEGDAHSPFNIVGGSNLGPVLDYLQPIRLDFVAPSTTTPATAGRVGAWNDPTGSRVQLSVYDVNGILLESGEADQGFFLGIARQGISYAIFTHVSNQRSRGFSLDDVSFALQGRQRVTLPTSANTPGLFGAFFKTNVAILNVGEVSSTVDAILFDQSGQVGQTVITVGPGQQRNFDNFLENVFWLHGSRICPTGIRHRLQGELGSLY